MVTNLVYIAVVFIVVIFSMTIHEAMHAYTSYWLGDNTAKYQGRLTLNPIKHIDPFLTILLPLMLALVGAPVFGGAKPVPFNPENVKFKEWGIALVALAGPLTNLLLAFVFYCISVFLAPSLFENYATSGLLGLVLYLGVVVNLGFFVFNMIPIPPLDGSRVLYALAPDFVRVGMESIERYSILFVFLIVFFASSFIGSFMSGSIKFILNIFQLIL